MNALVFPTAALLVVFAGVIPVVSRVAAGALAARRRRIRDWADFGDGWTFALLAAPTALPIVWLGASALHQTHPELHEAHCLLALAGQTHAVDEWLLVGLLAGGLALRLAMRVPWRSLAAVPSAPESRDAAARQRVRACVDGHPALRALAWRVVDHAPAPIGTYGGLRPVVVLDASFVAGLADDALLAALLHERAHVLGRDTLRFVLLESLLDLNPSRRLLAADAQRWREAREADCDRRAVHEGGQPLALAEGIVRAARFGRSPSSGAPAASAALEGDGRPSAVALRVRLLMRGVGRASQDRAHLVLAALALALAVAPFIEGLDLLEWVHIGAEALLASDDAAY